jgi:hypothetical protein
MKRRRGLFIVRVAATILAGTGAPSIGSADQFLNIIKSAETPVYGRAV